MQVEEKSHQHQGVFDHSLGKKVEDDQFRTQITEENNYFILGTGVSYPLLWMCPWPNYHGRGG